MIPKFQEAIRSFVVAVNPKKYEEYIRKDLEEITGKTVLGNLILQNPLNQFNGPLYIHHSTHATEYPNLTKELLQLEYNAQFPQILSLHYASRIDKVDNLTETIIISSVPFFTGMLDATPINLLKQGDVIPPDNIRLRKVGLYAFVPVIMDTGFVPMIQSKYYKTTRNLTPISVTETKDNNLRFLAIPLHLDESLDVYHKGQWYNRWTQTIPNIVFSNLNVTVNDFTILTELATNKTHQDYCSRL